MCVCACARSGPCVCVCVLQTDLFMALMVHANLLNMLV